MDFETGAKRSSDADNYSYYLITPIGMRRLAKIYGEHYEKHGIVELYLNECLNNLYWYKYGNRTVDYLAVCTYYLFEAMGIDKPSSRSNYDTHRFDLINPIGLRRLAETYQEGANKYGAFNVEKGMPIHDLLNHAEKHIYDYLEGKRDEDDLAHASWGFMMAMHSEELWPELNKAWLRGPNCTLTASILKRLNDAK